MKYTYPELSDKNLERIFIETNNERFVIEFQDINSGFLTDVFGKFVNFRGLAYPILDWQRATGKEKGWSYTSTHDGGTTDDLNDARIMFEFSFCWRGVWEGRIYFKDDEYWCEEINTMSELWKLIEPQLKDRIRKANPNNIYDI